MYNLVIMTTAITRGDFHKYSLGLFYRSKMFQNIKENFVTVYHIINIDEIAKLSKKFCLEDTIKVLNRYIPSYVVKYYIYNKSTVGFLNAYKKVVSKADEITSILENNAIVWWLEDDWKVVKDLQVFDIVKKFNYQNSAFNLVNNSPLGSFRAGPIMNYYYFKNFFNIIPHMNSTCDPEKQVNRWLSGIKRSNGKEMIERKFTNNKIDLYLIFINEEPRDLFPYYFYKKKFNEMIEFSYNFIHLKENKYWYSKDLKEYIELDFEIFNNDNLKYFSIYPCCFEDIGRKFNEENGLIKWSTINDNTTYT